MSASSARRSSFTPRVLALENRDCPSCTITFHDGMLSIVGDRSSNDVAVLNTWTGTQVRTQVHCDQQEPRSFVGVNSISVRTLDGDDHVGFASDTMGRPMPQLAVDLGGGNDVFTADVDVQPGPTNIAVAGGVGNDSLMANANFLPAVQSGGLPAVQFTLVMEGGAGNDTLMTNANFLPAVQSGELPAVQFNLDLDGGAGNDSLMANANFLPAVQFGELPAVQSNLDLEGGAGDDALLMNCQGSAPQLLDTTMRGGEGNDALIASTNFLPAVQSGELPAVQFNLDLAGGAGRDVLMYMKHGSTTQHSRAALAGGPGDDVLSVFGNGGAICAVDTREQIDMDGGAGSDLLTFFDLPAPETQTLLGYSYVLTMHGGGGDDTLIADARYFNGGGNTGSIYEYGDDGNDQHVLLFEGPFQVLQIDGGNGTDSGLSPSSHTPNVTVLNCEF